MPQEVQNPVHDVTHDLRLPRATKTLRLGDRLIHANKQLPMQARRFAIAGSGARSVVKRDHIGRAAVPEERFIEQRHFADAHQVDPEFRGGDAEVLKQGLQDGAQVARVDPLGPLPVEDGEGHFLLRCSS